MSRTRVIIIAVLALAPLLFLMAMGSYHLYLTGWVFIAWWPMTASLILAYGLAYYWTRPSKSGLLPETATSKPPEYWTDRDRKAWEIVAKKAAGIASFTPADLEKHERFSQDAMTLALEIAQNYQLGTKDPFGHLTLPEILTCAELVAYDLRKKVNTFVPFSHVVTVRQFQQARQAVDWGQKAWNISWLARAVINPIRTATQYAVSQAGGSVLTRVQNNILLWFYTAYLHELGRYLIELNSGRLKVGAERYRELLAAQQTPPTGVDDDQESTTSTEKKVDHLKVMMVGQVSSGKSSLTNALLGEKRAPTDVTPMTVGAVRYECQLPNLPKLTIVDTAGYGVDGPSEREFDFAVQRAQSADMLFFVLHARNAARKVDCDFMNRLQQTFRNNPALRMPPVLAVLTHVDLLSPAMEWSPPYDWEKGTRPKEGNIREAVANVKEVFPGQFSDVVPVCTTEGKLWNLAEGLMITVVRNLDHARGSAVLKLFYQEGSASIGRKGFDQMINAGREALKILWESAKKG